MSRPTRPRRRARLAVALGLAAGAALGPAVGDAAAQDTPPPAQWPQTVDVQLRYDGFPNGARLSGSNRYGTNLALALALRGTGDAPFDTPDLTSGGAVDLGGAGDWWGLARCPRAIIVVAGDTPADALSASALSDPTGQSSEPILMRTSSGNPTLFPVGAVTRVDTDSAPIIVTRSGRDGASGLSPAATVAARDLRTGGCQVARRAIVVGGPTAVPLDVEGELITLGYDQVFRVAGANRYDTAARIAASLGTAEITGGVAACGDPVTTDGSARMTFAGNSVVEFRTGPTSCQRLSRTVAIADGITGADALAAGWWLSFFQVPVLLHDGGSSLPAATRAQLAGLDVDNVVVLGGTTRISDAVMVEAASVAGAQAIRVAGRDRYETSVLMAQRLGGWWSSNSAADYAGSLVCLAPSSGSGDEARGWPDALGAGPWCGTANGAAANPSSPHRALAPTTGDAPQVSIEARPGHDAVPVLLVPFGAPSLPAPVEDLLTGAFAPSGNWCASDHASAGCSAPGFAVGFGGSDAVSDAVMSASSRIVGGGDSAAGQATVPTLTAPWTTELDLAPVFAAGSGAQSKVCAGRGAYADARWLAGYDPTDGHLIASADVMLDRRYLTDADATVRAPGIGAPVCLSLPAAGPHEVAAVGLDGRSSDRVSVDGSAGRRISLSASIAAATTAAEGSSSGQDPASGGTTRRTFTVAGGTVDVVAPSGLGTVTAATLNVALTRGTDGGGIIGPDVFQASWTLETSAGSITGAAAGEAIFSGATWELRGRSTIEGGSWALGPAAGGFAASWSVNAPEGETDDAVVWRFDAAGD